MAINKNPCLLGIIDEKIEDECNESYITSKIGGDPIWLNDIKTTDFNCSNCLGKRLFIGQIYCPVGTSNFHRVLYIFSCKNHQCSKIAESWLCLRQMKYDESTEYLLKDEHQKLNNFNMDWGTAANDWGDGDVVEINENSFKEECYSNEIHDDSTKSFNKSTDIKLNDYLTIKESYYINVFDETVSHEKFQHEKQLIKEYTENTIDDCSSCKSSAIEKYEKVIPENFNETSLKFYKYLSKYPQQIIRYEYGGRPMPLNLLTDNLDIEKCKYCGNNVHFEMQLMPALSEFIKVDIATILIYTCTKNCWDTNDVFKLEHVFVDFDCDDEKLNKLFNV